ncbi:hypothetical protein BX616_007192, partial [Lobosporangium transversale]
MPYYYVIIKSNSNPSPNLNDLQWTPVSERKISTLSQLTGEAKANEFVCAVDGGQFSILSTRGKPVTLVAATFRSGPIGIQYSPVGGYDNANPTLDEWREMTIGETYYWNKSYGSQLFYFKSSLDGSPTLMHVTADGPNGTRLSRYSNPSIEQNSQPWHL